ncbi:hypothetical protein KSB_42920 [Ktedonobacter robiniae]|uniref:RNA polymerase sigma factor 70 region 4 type 2 domain-containing protein n=1 Tax=Ktedonobacter robiniae TaxID=2778365 RepID=A0ABQ3UTA5_9CHLR|nr:hypothetical protein KSB_42920 [Ktedonobacter robiniae]
MILRYLHDRTYEEMAYILSLSIGTVKTQFFRARTQLSECILAQHSLAQETA